ncbi:UNVERIFIED_CONTAM: hypothetical protein BEN50_15450, partial [Euhalothece sp. KZN 001]
KTPIIIFDLMRERQLILNILKYLLGIETAKMSDLKYKMVIEWSQEDDCFLVALPDFPGNYWRTHGETYEEALANGKESLESLILCYED